MKTESPSPKAKKVSETNEHARLKATLREILRMSGFKFDTEVALNFSGNRDENGLVDERSIDIAAFGSKKKSFLLIFECKSGSDIKGIQSKISSWEADVEKMRNGKASIVSSQENSIKENDLNQCDDIRVCYVFGKSIDRERYDSISSTLKGRDFFSWDDSVLTYYRKTANTVGIAAKYEILREFDINMEAGEIFMEEAIKIKQGETEMYVFGAKPSRLLKIGYVYRRASGKPEAYQRILNGDRIAKISEFLSTGDAILPNAIIIAFDDDPEIQKDIRYDEKQGRLYFPSRYCSAWIIDGQHRVFGCLNTPYERIDDDDSDKIFELPVVAVKNLDLVNQNRTFVNINYNQKKIDPTLLCDLATALPDLQNELTWPSLLVAELNSVEPLKDKVKISELDKGRPISLSSFAQYGLLEGLLGYDKKKRTYNGTLFAYAPFKPRASLSNPTNEQALDQQSKLLERFFVAVAENTKKTNAQRDPWRNTKDYALVKTTGINALLLVLSRIMEKYPKVEEDIHKNLTDYLEPLGSISFKRDVVAKYGGGWKGFRSLANAILEKLNDKHGDSLRLFGEKEKK